MNGAAERRQRGGDMAKIEHGLQLKKTHGVSFAAAYLSNQRVGEETITRVLYGNWGSRRVVDCLSP